MANTYDPAQDPYAQRSTAVNSSARLAAAVVPSDTVNLTPYAKDVYVGVTGDVTVVPVNATDDSQTVLFKAVPAGQRIGCQVRRVMATGTTATNLLALMD